LALIKKGEKIEIFIKNQEKTRKTPFLRLFKSP